MRISTTATRLTDPKPFARLAMEFAPTQADSGTVL
jgi:hypothetical protein